MDTDLLAEIAEFLVETGMGEFRFGWLATRNGRLVSRLRGGGTVTLRTAERIRAFIADRRGGRAPQSDAA